MSDDLVAPGADGKQPDRPDEVVQKELPGRILQSRRQELNWSVEDVAHSLHLAPRQIHALEADDYGALPGMAVARGFLRSYAKLLKLDPAPLLQTIVNAAEVRNEDVPLRKALPDTPFYADRSLSWGAKPKTWVRSGLLALLLILAAVAIAWKTDFLSPSWLGELRSLLPTQAATSEGDTPESSARTVMQVESAPVSGSSHTTPLNPEATDTASADVAMIPGASGTSANHDAAVSGGEPEKTAVTQENKDLLVFKLREDSWIEVRDANNKPILARLLKAGESESIPVHGPLKLTVGNATGVDAQLRGVPVELSASARSNVARLTVN